MAEYVNKKELYEAYVDWYAKIEKCVGEGKPSPEAPRIILNALIDIPTHLAMKKNFSGYSFKDEMIGDAIENLIKIYARFDITRPEKNPFGYFSLICERAFMRRIMKERKQSYVKHCIVRDTDMSQFADMSNDDPDFSSTFIETVRMNLNPTLEDYYNKPKIVKENKEKTTDIQDLF